MYTAKTKIKVRYGETDQMGFLYYGFYAWYYEIGRVEALRDLGVVYKEVEEQGTLMVVGSLTSKFIKSAHYDEEIEVVTSIMALPKMGVLPFKTEMYNENGDLIHKGTVQIICIDDKTRKRKAVPDEIVEKLKPYFESKEK